MGKGRIDKKHRVTLRMIEEDHSEIAALSFKHRISINWLIINAINYAIHDPKFIESLKCEFPVDERKGHFVYMRAGGNG